MAESYKYKRVKFPKSQQNEFVLRAKAELEFTWVELAKMLGVSVRNLTDWKNEKISMPLGAVKTICKKAGLEFPENAEILDRYWYVHKGARKGGLAVLKKYGKVGGDEEKRKEKWEEWWNEKGKFLEHKILNPLPFRKPKLSKELAEFVGIVLGDGGISANQITITLHRLTDREYADYVKKLIRKLFGVPVGVYSSPRYLADNYIISRTGIVRFFIEELGLKIGNKIKNQIDIPDWIKEDNKFSIACLRGLVDTDGSIYTHKYFSGGKEYEYKKLSYCSRSLSLLQSVEKIMSNLEIKCRFTKNNFEVRIESQNDLKKYFNCIGSHNPKHLKKYRK